MRDITEEKIIELIKKYRDFIFSDIEGNLCLEHYNFAHRTNLTENDVVLEKSLCYFCKEEKTCVKGKRTD